MTADESIPTGRVLPTELVHIDSIIPHPRNYRSHPEDQLDHIARSIELHGFYRPIVVTADGTILAGHGVVLAARRLGIEEIPVTRVSVDPHEPRAIQILTGDNEMGNLADVDDRLLTELLRDLIREDLDYLVGTGFTAEQLAALTMVTRHSDEIADLDEAAEWLGMPAFEQIAKEPKLIITFDSNQHREDFVAKIEAQWFRSKTGLVWSMRWPNRPMHDSRNVRFE